MIQVVWDNEAQTIIRCDFEEGWSFNDLLALLDQIYQMMESVDTEAYVIFNLLEANSLPSVKLLNFKAATIKVHPRVKMFIDVTHSILITTLTDLFKRAYRDTVKIHVVRTLQEARIFIDEDMK